MKVLVSTNEKRDSYLPLTELAPNEKQRAMNHILDCGTPHTTNSSEPRRVRAFAVANKVGRVGCGGSCFRQFVSDLVA